MFRVYIFTTTLITIIYPIACTRKYDIETEAQKLYGEDLVTVLKRFRRTPEYLSILKDRLDDMRVTWRDIALQLLHYHVNTLKGRVAEILGVTLKTDGAVPTEQPNNDIEGFFMRHGSRKQGDPDAEESAPEVQETSLERERHAVESLDHYEKLNSQLTVAERNSFRDLGFEVAGNIFHGLIKNMGCANPDNEEDTGKSTKGILQGEPEQTSSTTEHVIVHEVTTAGHTEETQSPPPEDTTSPDRLRNKGRGRGRG